ncbi:MAG: type I methionyl aminopeptidase [Planctomycetota bacterium]
MIRRNNKQTHSEAELAAIRESAHCVVETHRAVSSFLRIGVTLAQIDQFVAETLDSMGAKSCFLGYRVPRTPPFPSHACLSVNDCVVHGMASYRTEPLQPGDVLKLDIGVRKAGWIGDAAWTYAFGEPDETTARLMECGKLCIRRGIEKLVPGRPLIEWARAVQHCVEKEYGLHLIRGLGGHGYGKALHEPPYISNTVPISNAEWPDAYRSVQPGMLLAVEPMLASGTGRVEQEPGGWPMYTADGSQSVHYEHDVLITADGPEVLTAGLEELSDIVTK